MSTTEPEPETTEGEPEPETVEGEPEPEESRKLPEDFFGEHHKRHHLFGHHEKDES
jgi:hypothetical protein